MKTIKGNLIKLALNNEFDVIIHGCNCFCRMGSGIAKQIKEAFPPAYNIDKITTKGDRKKLGNITYAECNNLTIVNAYTQYYYGYDGKQYVDYDAVRSCLKEIYKNFGLKNYRFGFPQIGCGLAGGNWNIVSKIIEEEMHKENVTIVIFDK